MRPLRLIPSAALSLALLLTFAATGRSAPPAAAANVFPIEQGYVDAGGVLLYYEALGRGEPLVVVHGGPGASHDYFLPYLIPLARHNRVVFLDERGSGKSTKLEDPKGYTVEAMADDVEAVRKALGLGRINLLGHSYGGVVAQAYALKYQQNLAHLVLSSTFSSTRELNEDLKRMKDALPAEAREKVDKLEAAGLFGQGKPWEHGRYPDDYMRAAWGDGYFAYLYGAHPDPAYEPVSPPATTWDLYREMWGSHGEFIVDGNLVSVEYNDRLGSLKVPTLVTVGEHDQVDPVHAKALAGRIPGAKLVVLPNSGHMVFVDQPEIYLKAVDEFLHGR
jgi:proline iminopeptidase